MEEIAIANNSLAKGSKFFVARRDIEEFGGINKKERVPYDEVIASTNNLRPANVTTALYKVKYREKAKGLYLCCWTLGNKAWLEANGPVSCTFCVRAKHRDGDDFATITEVPDVFILIGTILDATNPYFF
jgi:hypothetical protein